MLITYSCPHVPLDSYLGGQSLLMSLFTATFNQDVAQLQRAS